MLLVREAFSPPLVHLVEVAYKQAFRWLGLIALSAQQCLVSMPTYGCPALLLRGQLAGDHRQGNLYHSHVHKILTDYWYYSFTLKLELLGSILLAVKYKIYLSPLSKNITGAVGVFLTS